MIDWDEFSSRVSVGTQVRAFHTFGVEVIRRGILLENTPCFEEHVARVCDSASQLAMEYAWCIRNPFLRYQDFSLTFEGKFLPLYTYAQFSINDQWLTFGQVMA